MTGAFYKCLPSKVGSWWASLRQQGGPSCFGPSPPVVKESTVAVKKSQNPALQVANAIEEAMTLVGSRLFREARLALEQAEQVAKRAGLASSYLAWGLSVVSDECQDAANAVKFIKAALTLDPCAPPFINSYLIIRGRTILAFNGMDVNDPTLPTFFRLLVDLDAVDAAACIKFSRHAAAHGDPARALSLAQDAVQIQPPTAERLRHLASLLATAGRHEEARARETEADALVSFDCPTATA